MQYETRTIGTEDVIALPGEPAPRGPRWGLIAGIVVAVLAIVILGYVFFGHRATAPQKATEQLPLVSVVVPGRSAVARTVTATGSLAARREMPIGVSGEGGIVTRVLVEPGQWVEKGQVLAQVDRSVQTQTAASLAAQIKVSQADATLAQSELDRAKQLVSRGFISRADIETKTATRDAAFARVKVAQAQLAQQQASNGRLDVRAPARGLVLTRSVEAGQVVSAGAGVLFRMAEGGQLELRAQVSENDLRGLHVGSQARVTPVGGATVFTGEVWQVSPVIDPTTRQGIARIALNYDPALRPGGFASAAIVAGTTNVPELPNAAIQSDDKGNYVYVVGPDDKLVRRSIKVGEVSDSGVAITDGLNGTEKVVQSAGAFLNAGQKVKPTLVTADMANKR
ncbi:efflux RND transporter periplasmic adaptor subunit [Sphingomonas glacialis]|uniref:Efflux RND transporter periplasmic adaptor subunit n=1 Tax=Sphingomonas glacialis TaxID=658225 RepID=A0A502FI49_9SPHN|nr:efflux RND transporter periplasmic adaptor subunit [Sphingomonas glacialis]TPG49167.1 efflux RND transporter periplasmic adaptor subunit [Sphingomonas glacialis]